tara:strand:+ start:15 stop:419 length:405 start_codon:yes stop_codon:yes gene_type:complete
MAKKNIEVVAAIIKYEGEILCVQRGDHKLKYIANKYEFPGGKVEAGESREQAIIREIKEELDMDISVNDLLITIDHEYPDFCITMHCFYCECKSKDLTLNEHTEFKWLLQSELESLDWAAADIPVVNKLRNSGK